MTLRTATQMTITTKTTTTAACKTEWARKECADGRGLWVRSDSFTGFSPKTLMQCEAICDANPRCNSIAHLDSDQHCFLKELSVTDSTNFSIQPRGYVTYYKACATNMMTVTTTACMHPCGHHDSQNSNTDDNNNEDNNDCSLQDGVGKERVR
mmetsp:Transcript_95184/g.175057  ORF Transcript_95184/g.175057 Transcript_95184/m.175057 type:complete len:153 (-) Transcript_95184:244-702(-)